MSSASSLSLSPTDTPSAVAAFSLPPADSNALSQDESAMLEREFAKLKANQSGAAPMQLDSLPALQPPADFKFDHVPVTASASSEAKERRIVAAPNRDEQFGFNNIKLRIWSKHADEVMRNVRAWEARSSSSQMLISNLATVSVADLQQLDLFQLAAEFLDLSTDVHDPSSVVTSQTLRNKFKTPARKLVALAFNTAARWKIASQKVSCFAMLKTAHLVAKGYTATQLNALQWSGMVVTQQALDKMLAKRANLAVEGGHVSDGRNRAWCGDNIDHVSVAIVELLLHTVWHSRRITSLLRRLATAAHRFTRRRTTAGNF